MNALNATELKNGQDSRFCYMNLTMWGGGWGGKGIIFNLIKSIILDKKLSTFHDKAKNHHSRHFWPLLVKTVLEVFFSMELGIKTRALCVPGMCFLLSYIPVLVLEVLVSAQGQEKKKTCRKKY